MWEQLTYTSVDEVRDGVAVSGWHVKDRSEGLTSEQVDGLVSFLRPSFSPVSPLPGFPTRDEIEGAEVRLAQRGTVWGTMLVHTAQAGVDATLRPNFFTHVLLDVNDDTNRPALGIDMWRAECWLSPFGPERVRSSDLPRAADIHVGTSVSEESSREWMTMPTHKGVLVALADGVSHRVDSRSSCEDGQPITSGPVVLGVSDGDEAAQWVAALSRLCAPSVARSLCWSLWERITVPQDLEDLVTAGFDVVCVPREDLSRLPHETGPSIILDAASELGTVPTSSWGLLVERLLSSGQTVDVGLRAMSDVLSELPDQKGLTLGWSLAMVEACDPGVLSEGEPKIRAAVDRELLSAAIPALHSSAYLRSVATDWIMDAVSEDPRHWASKLLLVDSERSPESLLLDALITKYLTSGSVCISHIHDARASIDPATVGFVGAWSRDSSHAGKIAELATVSEQTLRAADSNLPEEVAALGALDWLHREGVERIPVREERLLLNSVVSRAISGSLDEHSPEFGLDLSARTLGEIADLVEDELDPAGAVELPRLREPITAWLRGGVDPSRHHQLAAELAINDFQRDPGKEVGPLLSSLGDLPGGWTLAEGHQKLLGEVLTLEDLTAVSPNVLRGIEDSVALALVASPQCALTDSIAMKLRSATENREGTRALGGFSFPRSFVEAVLGITEAWVHQDICAAGVDPNDEEAILAYQVVEAATFLERWGLDEVAMSDFVDPPLRASLMVLILRVWGGLPLAIVYERQGGHVSAVLDRMVHGNSEAVCVSFGRLRPLELSNLMKRVVGVLRADLDRPDEGHTRAVRRASLNEGTQVLLHSHERALESAWPCMRDAGRLVLEFTRRVRHSLPGESREALDEALLRTPAGSELLLELNDRSMLRQAEKVLDRAAFWRRRQDPSAGRRP